MKVSIVEERHSRRHALPRVYVHPADETVFQNFLNRRSRPYALWRKEVLPKVWEAVGATDVKVRWSSYAGCKCPCSPGFVVISGYAGPDLFVQVEAES